MTIVALTKTANDLGCIFPRIFDIREEDNENNLCGSIGHWRPKNSFIKEDLFPVASVPYKSATANSPITEASFITPRLDIERADINVIARIRGFGNYAAGWDGDEGVSPSEAAIKQAEIFARLLPFDKIYAPHISLAADGEINFLWALKDFRFDLGFYGHGTYSYYGRTADGKEFMADEIPVNRSLPEQIIKLIEND